MGTCLVVLNDIPASKRSAIGLGLYKTLCTYLVGKGSILSRVVFKIMTRRREVG